MSKLLNLRRSDRCARCGAEQPAGIKAYWSKADGVICIPCHESTGLDSGIGHMPETLGTYKLLNLRRASRCAGCGRNQPVGTKAYWLKDDQTVRCLRCMVPGPGPDRHEEEAVDTSSTSPPASDVAGGSARAGYERRSKRELARKQRAVEEDQKSRAKRVENRPLLGKIANALTPEATIGPESQSTKAWSTGADGEERVAEVLTGVAGIEVLHDRRVPGSTANIDHIVVGPSGVFVIDAKKYTGRVEVVDKGGWFKIDDRLYVGGRDRTKLVDGVVRQIDVVRTALGVEFASVPVRGVLCFIGAEWGLLGPRRPKTVRGVTALWPVKLPECVSQPGEHGDSITAITERLRAALKPAR